MEDKTKKIPDDPPDRWFNTCLNSGGTRAEENVDVEKMCKFLWKSKKDEEKAKIYLDNTAYPVPRKTRKDEIEIDDTL